ncbi:MAG: hypothetical protein F7B59_05065 [Desulfurococcales archaeon]|nr:hypothetical protein [Desulfurococcales archaeon]
MEPTNIDNILSKHFSPNKREIYFLETSNGNTEVLVRRSVVEKIEGISLSSIASGIIDFEVIPQNIRHGIIGTLQIPLIVVGPFSYRRKDESIIEKTYIPLAYIADDVNNIALKLADIEYDPEKIRIKSTGIEDSLKCTINIPGFRTFLISFAIASALKMEDLVNKVFMFDYWHADSLSVEQVVKVNVGLFETNPTIIDIAKIMTGKENPQLIDYERKLKETLIFVLELARTMPQLFQ